jgi:DNA-binding response OmpR family regulator
VIKRILIIDDDRNLSDEIVEILTEEGFFVEAAHDGLEGEELIRKNRFDCIFVDIKMPRLNGFELIKKTRSISPDSRFFIISSTPFLENALKEEGLTEAVSCFINKPFDMALLIEKLKSC